MGRKSNRARGRGSRSSSRRRGALIVPAAVLAEVAGVWLRSGRLGGKLTVRCRQGHLFTTLWLPGASLKSFRLGWWRFQRCPVGPHWSWVTPVRESELSAEERRAAREHQGIAVP